ncbi:hypothetical protein, partial [Pseudomonas aeruginosa]|uniref:hypothetical protein n=1 Tax=Pseudomonas aeruginosa TaxID=287 RepID=UPI0024BE820E
IEEVKKDVGESLGVEKGSGAVVAEVVEEGGGEGVGVEEGGVGEVDGGEGGDRGLEWWEGGEVVMRMVGGGEEVEVGDNGAGDDGGWVSYVGG